MYVHRSLFVCEVNYVTSYRAIAINTSTIAVVEGNKYFILVNVYLVGRYIKYFLGSQLIYHQLISVRNSYKGNFIIFYTYFFLEFF